MDYKEIWYAELNNYAALALTNAADDIRCGFDPTSSNIREQLDRMFLHVAQEQRRARLSTMGMTHEQAEAWYFADLVRKGLIAK